MPNQLNLSLNLLDAGERMLTVISMLAPVMQRTGETINLPVTTMARMSVRRSRNSVVIVGGGVRATPAT